MSENRRLSGIMFTDIVGYSAVMGKNESAAMKLLEDHKNISTPIIEKYNGKILKPQGDGFMIDFSSVVDAVRCAMDIQKEFSNYNKDKTQDKKIMLRIGIHMGDLIIKDNDIYGNDINIASRIEKLSDPGGICISQTVYDQIKNKVEIDTLELGQTELKNIEDKINIYKVLLEAQEKADTTDTNSEQKKDSKNKAEDDTSNIKETIKKKIEDNLKGKIPNINIKDGDEKIEIGPSGIKVKDKDGSEVEIGLSGIKVKEKNGDDVNIDLSGIKIKEKDGSEVEIALGGIKVKEKGKKKKKNTKKKKMSNLGKSIITLMSGCGFLVIVIGLFTELYEFWPWSVVGTIGIGVLSGTIKAFLEYNLRRSIIKLIGGCGFLVVIIGLFTELYEFWPWSVIGGIGIGILVTFLITLFGISDSGGGKARASVEFEYKP